MATKEKTEGKQPEEQGQKQKDSSGRDIVREQEQDEETAQTLVQERHMNPDAFK